MKQFVVRNVVFLMLVLSTALCAKEISAISVVDNSGVDKMRLSHLFSDNMVIQRNTDASVWGWAKPGQKIVVSGSWGQEAMTIAGHNGKWILKLQTPNAGGPYIITVKGNNTITLNNVLSGDVWLCSGQSNMYWPVKQSANADKEITAADYPAIRFFSVPESSSNKQVSDLEIQWRICSPETVGDFSATAYYTARELQKEINVPIGLIRSAYRGTRIEAWIDKVLQKDDAKAQKRIREMDKASKTYDYGVEQAHYEKAVAEWKVKVAEAKRQGRRKPRKPKFSGVAPNQTKRYPGNLYNAMIHPLIPVSVKGVMWYQGEANSNLLADAKQYRVQLDRLITSWRSTWQSNFPFYFVQLPGHKKPQTKPAELENGRAMIRDSFLYVDNNTPNTGMAVTYDIGEIKSNHPRNKQDVGLRLASVILNRTYKMNTPTSPKVVSAKADGDKLILSFEYTGSGFMVKGEKLTGFAIAGSDHNYVCADAVIKQENGKDVIVLHSSKVKKPFSARYAWATNPTTSNLYSKEGLPAAPFHVSLLKD